MKKILFTATILVSFSAFVKAQQRGVGINTTTPAATLDVVANTTDNTMPDAVLVPRMSEDQLAAKNAAYVAGQNGALVFVNAVDGATTAKTVNVTAVGFYYYDNPSSTWKALGGASTATGMTVRAQTANTISDADLGNAIVVTSNVTFNLATLTKTNGKIITFIDATNGGGFSVSGAHSTATVAPIQSGGSLAYICDGTNWYSYNSF